LLPATDAVVVVSVVAVDDVGEENKLGKKSEKFAMIEKIAIVTRRKAFRGKIKKNGKLLARDTSFMLLHAVTNILYLPFACFFKRRNIYSLPAKDGWMNVYFLNFP